ncbi:MAG: haloacid dehalogenase-like hydrolase [Hungatella sp.]|nr:haloacid dehalogenase-like hydrolase [Hungatella sp.]
MINKMAVFDLDGTLWDVNSHIDIINKYYNKRLADNICIKVFRRIFPSVYMRYLNFLFDKIPDNFVKYYTPDLNDRVMDLWNDLKGQGYRLIIVSNAPERLINNASIRLKVECFHAEIAKKDELVGAFAYDYLWVVSDNCTDYNLMKMADKSTVILNKYNKAFFEGHKLETMEFLSD